MTNPTPPKPKRRRSRGNMEGSIRRRPNGTWEARYTAGVSEAGKQVRRSVYGHTRAEVAEKLKAKLAETERGALVLAEHGKLTTIDYARAHLEARRPEVGPGTHAKLSSYITILAHTPEAGGLLTDLTPARLERLYAALATRYAPSTVRHLSVFLNQVLRRAVRHGVLRTHPGLVADLPRMQSEPRAQPLTDADLGRVLAAAAQTPWYALFATIAALGLRHGEALGLQWGDLDLDAGTVQVNRTVVSRNGTPAISEPKTRASRRTLYFSEHLATILRDHQAVVLGRRHGQAEPTSWVFPNRFGGMLSQHNVRRVWAEILAAAELPAAIRIHDLRHSFVSRLITSGADPKTAADLAGHADPRMTLGLYTHTQAEARKAAQLRAGGSLDGMLEKSRRGEAGVKTENEAAS